MKKAVSLFLFLLFVYPIFAYADIDDIFQVKTPNVMIIFDTSNSMDNQPTGYAQASGYMCVKNDGSGSFIAPDGKGNCSAGYTKLNFESGGNHPNSKLYQAKQALKTIIDTVVKDHVNLGISTYAQSKTEIRRGYYQRDRRDYTIPTVDKWKWTKLYWRFNNYRHGPWSSISLSKNSFTDAWGILRTSVSVGTTFTRSHTFDNSWNNNKVSVPPPHPPGTYLGDLKITVTSIVYNAENNWYTFSYQDDTHDHYEETTRTLTFADNSAIICDAQFGKAWNGYKTYDSKDAVQISNPAKWACVGPTLVPGTAGGFGSWYKEYAWLQFSATTCPATSGVDNLPVNATQTTKYSFVGSCYDYSSYSYPADGSTNKPHAWGYYKVSGGTWKNSAQSPNYYPSIDGGGNLNMDPGTYNNHFFFLNFPDDKDANFKETTRTTIMNKVDSFLDLTPVQSPETLRYWTKLPVQNTAGRIGLTSNTVASNYTPLADSLAAANRYFNDYIYNYNGGDSSSLEKFGETLCRGNYVILLTDGLESCRMNGGTPDYGAAPAEAANLLAINVKTFVIGFGSDLSGNLTLNNIAGSGGTGKAYFATNMAELQGALQSIFGTITGQYYGRSNPVITRARDRLFRGDFDIQDGQWRGHLTAWDADAQTGVLAPDFKWDAGEVMKSKPRGKVYAWTDPSPNPTRIEFQDDSSLYSLVNPFAEDINEDGKVDSLDARTVINFTLDSNYNDGTHGAGYYKGKRATDWKLGDIYHSTPVVIAEPAFYFSENGYTDFYNANKNREMIIYVGTNDGMLHGFKNSDGSKKFAVIPRNLLGNLRRLKNTHKIYVDSSPKAYDVYFKSESKWKTVIITGERDGGSYYFALDVTNPDDPRVLWEWTDASLGNTWSKPDVGKVLVNGQTKYVALFTGGYSTTDNTGNTFYIVNIEDGSLVKSFTVGGSTNKIPAGPTAFDADQDGYIDSVYFGDTSGTLWKVDVRDGQTANWTLYNFYTPSVLRRRPIYYSPAVVKNDLGKTLVYFGTGNELNLMDPSSTDYFYEIEDQGATGHRNWRKNLQAGEKVLASPSVANWVVYFTSWVYKADGQFCGAGEGRLWGLKVSSSSQTGGVAGLVTLDTDTGRWKDPVEYISLGVGIPSAPVVTNGMVYVSTSLNANKVIQIPIPPWAKAKLKSWREVTK